MIFYILTGLAVLWIIAYGIYEAGSPYRQDLQEFFGVSFFTALIWLAVVLGGTSILNAALPATEYRTESRGLTALANRTDQPGGYFFLGSGVVEDREVYRYMEQDETGGNRMRDIPVDYAVIYESDGEPRLEKVTGFGNRWWLTPWKNKSFRGTENHFYIPEGSIARNFEVTP